MYIQYIQEVGHLKNYKLFLPLSGTLMRRSGCRDDLSCEGVKVSGFLSKALTERPDTKGQRYGY